MSSPGRGVTEGNTGAFRNHTAGRDASLTIQCVRRGTEFALVGGNVGGVSGERRLGAPVRFWGEVGERLTSARPQVVSEILAMEERTR